MGCWLFHFTGSESPSNLHIPQSSNCGSVILVRVLLSSLSGQGSNFRPSAHLAHSGRNLGTVDI